MGNAITTVSSIYVPLINHLVTVPYLFHPHRWGGVPFKQPNFLYLGFIGLMVNIASLMIIGTVSGMMSTSKECRKINIIRSIKRSLWIVLGYYMGNLFLTFFPFVKAPALLMTVWLPYSGWIVHGMFVSAFILFFGAMGNSILRNEVCRGIY